jgi:hypothetical protein
LTVVHYMLSNFFPAQTEHDKLRLQCVSQIHDMYREMESWGPDSGPKVAMLARRHLLLYRELSLEAASKWPGGKGEPWRVYPKHHLFQHCCEDQVALAGNPREHWTYADESCIGLIAKLAESCHATTLQTVVMARYRVSRP